MQRPCTETGDARITAPNQGLGKVSLSQPAFSMSGSQTYFHQASSQLLQQPCPWLSCLWCWGLSPWRFHANLKIRRPSFWLIGCLMALRRESQCFFHFDIFCLFTMLGLGAPPHSTQPLKESNPYNQLHFNQKKKKKTGFLCWPWRHTTQSLGLEPWPSYTWGPEHPQFWCPSSCRRILSGKSLINYVCPPQIYLLLPLSSPPPTRKFRPSAICVHISRKMPARSGH